MSLDDFECFYRSAEIANDHERLENMATMRNELKSALSGIKDEYSDRYLSTINASSFIQMTQSEIKEILENQLRTLEEDISKLCKKIQEQLGN